jgi:hypothetical protein
MAKAALNKKNYFLQQIGLRFKEETSEVLHLVLKLGHIREWIEIP